MNLNIRPARKEDAQFLAKCIMAGMHFNNFEDNNSSELQDMLKCLTDCEERPDTIYTFKHTRVAEIDGVPAGSLLSYPGEIYKEVRTRTFREIWSDMGDVDNDSEQETGPGEFYLDSLAVHPDFRGKGIGRALMLDGIEKGKSLGYKKIALLVDEDYPHLVKMYSSIGFHEDGHRHVFGVNFLRMVFEIA